MDILGSHDEIIERTLVAIEETDQRVLQTRIRIQKSLKLFTNRADLEARSTLKGERAV